LAVTTVGHEYDLIGEAGIKLISAVTVPSSTSVISPFK
jgi:hypothetical protein